MNYTDAKKFLLSPEMNISRPGLERIKKVLEILDNPQNKLKVIHVVGTNGKGSVSSMLGNVLFNSGLKVGMFCSPYLNSLTEYIKINNEMISETDFGKYAGYIKNIIDKENLMLTHFEFVTVMSVFYFLDSECDICIYEAGLGGVSDATNIFDSAICNILTSVSVEHSAFLGNSLEEIIVNKAGIVKENEWLISSDSLLSAAFLNNSGILRDRNIEIDKFSYDIADLAVGDIINNYCKNNNISLWTSEEVSYPEIKFHSSDKIIFLYDKFEDVLINSGGMYQVENAMTVIETCKCLKHVFGYQIDNMDILNGISDFYINCRFEKIHDTPKIIVDGGHNPECIKELIKSLEKDVKYTIVTGVMADKDYINMYSHLAPYAERFICIDNKLERALDSEILCLEIQNLGLKAYNAGDCEIAAAMIKCLCKENDSVLYVGTLYLAEAFKSAVSQVYNESLIEKKYSDTVQRLTAKDFYSKNYSLADMKIILKEFGSPHEKIKCIHVAGTNGKGSTCSMLYLALVKMGFKTGLFTSPYIKVFNERIALDGKNIENEMLVAISERIIKVQEKHGIDLNQFALITCIAFVYYSLMDTDYVVLETGLGGTYDPTNIVSKPVCSVITNIGLDHTSVLGNSIQQIAEAKAGIIKEGVPVICYPVCNEAFKVISSKAKCMNSELIPVKKEMVEVLSSDGDGTSFLFLGNKYFTALTGDFQAYNSAVAITVLKMLFGNECIDSDNIKDSLKKVSWQGRLEKISDKPLCYIDGGHNPQCIENVVGFFNKRYNDYKKIYIAGFMKDKDYTSMIKILADNSDVLYLVPVNFGRSLTISELSEEADKYDRGIKVLNSMEEAYHQALENASKVNNGVICIIGSLYQLKDVYLINESKKWRML